MAAVPMGIEMVIGVELRMMPRSAEPTLATVCMLRPIIMTYASATRPILFRAHCQEFRPLHEYLNNALYLWRGPANAHATFQLTVHEGRRHGNRDFM